MTTSITKVKTNVYPKTAVKYKKMTFKKAIKKYYGFYLMLLLPLIHYVVFAYVPMVGNILAFRKFSYESTFSMVFGSEWVGGYYFKQFLTSQDFWIKLINTIVLNVKSLVCSFPAPIIFALLINELRDGPFKKFVQTSSYLPNFISGVVVAGMIFSVLSPNGGVINSIRAFMGLSKIHFIIEPNWFHSIYIVSGIWQGMGWSAILYIAALSGIDMELYEAAMLDGAGRLRQTWHITLPGIAPTIVISLILSVGSLLGSNTEKIILLMNDLNMEKADVIGSYVFRVGLWGNSPNYSFATAIGLFNAVIGFVLVYGANRISGKISETSLW